MGGRWQIAAASDWAGFSMGRGGAAHAPVVDQRRQPLLDKGGKLGHENVAQHHRRPRRWLDWPRQADEAVAEVAAHERVRAAGAPPLRSRQGGRAVQRAGAQGYVSEG